MPNNAQAHLENTKTWQLVGNTLKIYIVVDYNTILNTIILSILLQHERKKAKTLFRHPIPHTLTSIFSEFFGEKIRHISSALYMRCLWFQRSGQYVMHLAVSKSNLSPAHTFVAMYSAVCNIHDDIIKWKHFPHYRPFVQGIHRSTVNSPHKGQRHGALMFSLICAWMDGWVNTHEAGD